MNTLRSTKSWISLAFLVAGTVAQAQVSQSYLNDTGSTAYGIQIPVENGYIDISNGNLHLEFPMASQPQRGALTLSEKLVYDSRIWMFSSFGTHGSYHWWPTNVYGASSSSGGWRFVTGGETGQVQFGATTTESDSCTSPGDTRDGDQGLEETITRTVLSYLDPGGTLHPTYAMQQTDENDCTRQTVTSILPNVAVDGSGYSIHDDGNANPVVVDSGGTQVFPQVIDRFGNYWSSDSNGNLIDDTGRTPVIVTQNGNSTYYDVLAANGPISNNGTRVRYTVTVASVNVSTNFQPFSQSDIYPWTSPGLLMPVQSITLPDGSSYSFEYDANGEMSSVTLPTGGVITYGYVDFVDSSTTENRWLSSRTVGSNPAMTFTPSVVTACTNYSSGCVENVTVHKPSGDETVYQLTLNNGAWNTGSTSYTGAVGSQPLAQETGVNSYTNACNDFSLCAGANYLTQSFSTSVLFANPGVPNGSSVYTQTLSLFDQYTGKPTATKIWGYQPYSTGMNTATPPQTTPTRQVSYTYTGFDPYQTQVLDSSGSQAGLTTYSYTTSATSTSGISQHGTVNAGGPYLQTVSHWLNTGGSSTTTYTMDDTGMVVGAADANGNPASVITYQCSNSLLHQSTNPIGQMTQYGYDCASGAIQSAQDPNDLANGRAGTTYKYEAVAGRIFTQTRPDGGVTTYTYPSANEVDTSTTATPNPSVASATIADAYGRPDERITAGNEVDSSYDVNGRAYCTSNPYAQGSTTSGTTCISSYDGLDRPLTQTQQDGSTVQWSYSANTSNQTNELSATWTRTSDALGHLTSVVEPGPSGALTTNYSYDGLGNVSKIDQLGNAGSDTARVRTFTYDSASRLICASQPEAALNACPASATGTIPQGVLSYSYYPAGNVHTKTSPLANASSGTQTITYSYDALNRLVQRSFPVLPAASTPKYSYSCYQYDTTSVTGAGETGNFVGRLTNSWTQINSSCPSSPPSGALSRHSALAYDPVGRLLNDQQCTAASCGRAVSYTPSYTYDLAGNLYTHSSGIPGGAGSFTFTNTYDAGGHLASVTSNNTQYPTTNLFTAGSISSSSGCSSAVSTAYSPAGALSNATFGIGLQLSRGYDQRLRLNCESDIGNSVQNPTPGAAAIVINGSDQTH